MIVGQIYLPLMRMEIYIKTSTEKETETGQKEMAVGGKVQFSLKLSNVGHLKSYWLFLSLSILKHRNLKSATTFLSSSFSS